MGSQMDINTCTIHIHILNNVWEQKWDDWDTNTLPYRGTQVSIKLCIGGWADMGSQVDINWLLMHVHILTNVYDQKQDDWDTHIAP